MSSEQRLCMFAPRRRRQCCRCLFFPLALTVLCFFSPPFFLFFRLPAIERHKVVRKESDGPRQSSITPPPPPL